MKFAQGLTAALALACGAVLAQAVDVQDGWVRTAVPGQKASGAFMKITAQSPLRLVAATTPVAGLAEVHEMKLDGEIMRMRPLAGLDLPAGKTVELRPGGYHLMLLDLKQPLPKGSTVPLTLTFQDAQGVKSTLQLRLPVGLAAPVADAGDGHKH